MEDILECTYREEKSLSHVVMVANFLEDKNPKTSLKKWIRTVSSFNDLIQFHIICQEFNVGEIFWGWVKKEKKTSFVLCSPTP